jgi:hypothetical protein
MLQQDFILRAIHQVAAALARIMAAKKEGRWDDALTDIEAGLTSITGMTAAQLAGLPLATILATLREHEDLGGESGGAVARLLIEHADILEASGRGDGKVFRVKAFCLLDELGEAGVLPPQHEETLRRLVERLA